MAIYYIKNSGNDTNTGLSDAQAWSFTKLATFVPANGDSILFNRGESFYGTLTLAKSASVGVPVTYGAYGTGALPVITSLKTLTGWTNHSGNIWKVSTGIPANCGVVTIDGVSEEKGHWPASGYAIWDTNVGITSITDSDIPASPSFTGANLVLFKSNWTIDRSLITDHTNHTITYTSGSSNAMQTSGGKRYLIQDSIHTLTYHGAWYCDGTDFYMYLDTAPENYVIKAGATDYTVICSSKHYNTVQDLQIEGGNLYAYRISNSSNHNIKDCIIKNTGLVGISGLNNGIAGASYLTIDGCSVSYINGTGISVNGEGTTIKNNVLDRCGQYAGMGAAGGGSHYGIYSKGVGNITEYNRITNTGYIPIFWESSSAQCRYNFVQTYPTLGLNDGGGIYTFESVTPQLPKKCFGNIIKDSTANGLYSDGLGNNVEFYNNLVYNVDKWGIHMNEPFDNNVHDNIFYDCGLAAIDITNQYFLGSPAAYDNIVANNTVLQASATQVLYSLQDAQANNIINFGTSDNNLFLVDASANAVFYNSYVTPTYHTDYMNFSAWKALTGKETNSVMTVKDLSKMSIEYNDSKIESTISLSTPKKDLSGTVYATEITLQPFASIVLEDTEIEPVLIAKYLNNSSGKYLVNSTGKFLYVLN